MKKIISLLALCCFLLTAHAGNETFKVCTYNIDGLPSELSVFGLNIPIKKDGAGPEGTLKNGEYFAGKDYDIIGVNEDFQYHNELMQSLSGKYDCGTWQGPIEIKATTILELLESIPINVDGLDLLWKKNIKAEDESLTTFTNAYGLIDHENDSLVSKGFRYYKVTLETGTEIDMYITHMDASVNLDDAEDIRVRRIQLKQIADAINANHNGRPIILMGDTNCNYEYDDVNGLLIDAINSQGEKTITDVWTYMGKPGKDIWDKVFFINQKSGKQIVPIKYEVDSIPKLSDHDPVVVTFSVTDQTTGIDELPTEDVVSENISAIYSLSGMRRQSLEPGVNIVRLRDGRTVKVLKR